MSEMQAKSPDSRIYELRFRRQRTGQKGSQQSPFLNPPLFADFGRNLSLVTEPLR